jgi:hypothetical protein
MAAGIEQAQGILITMDGDLQNDRRTSPASKDRRERVVVSAPTVRTS